MFPSKETCDMCGRVVMITGAANGIGLNVAKKIKAKGGDPCVRGHSIGLS